MRYFQIWFYLAVLLFFTFALSGCSEERSAPPQAESSALDEQDAQRQERASPPAPASPQPASPMTESAVPPAAAPPAAESAVPMAAAPPAAERSASPMTERAMPKAAAPPAAEHSASLASRHLSYWQGAAPDTARYGDYDDNAVEQVAKEPLSTFGLDVDTASYANVRRFLNAGRAPHPDAVRAEEMLNYFPWAAEELSLNLLPVSGSIGAASPFALGYELAPSPWNSDKLLLSLTLKARDVETAEMPPANLVFLMDVSGSMGSPERLPLVKSALLMLVDNLREQDRISLVTYSGYTEVALAATPGNEKARIRAAIGQLRAGGSTAGGAGLTLAYEQAEQNLIKGGINRILLCTDGDFNVGVASTEELAATVTRKRDSGITLSVLGYGTSNFNDAMMVKIADNGNGNYSYVDNLSEAKKVLDEEMRATLITVAKDAKAQIEFNPAAVLEYRQIGYEKRQLRPDDFNNDAVDAGDIGAGKQVTVLYELTLVGGKSSVDPLRYSQPAAASETGAADELAFVKLRWKEKGEEESKLAELPLKRESIAPTFDQAGTHLRFSASVAAYAQKLRNNPNLAKISWDDIALWAKEAKGADPGGYRSEFVKLVGLAETVVK